MGRHSSWARGAGLLAGAGLILAACGSSDNKRKDRPIYDGSGGDAGSGVDAAGAPGATAGTAGTVGTAGTAGTGGVAGAAGTPGGSDGGAAGEAPISSTGGAGGAGGDAATSGIGLYIGGTGDDVTGSGTADAPFKTLAHAASVATSGDTIVFLDGTYTLNAAVAIPAGINLKAENPGAATLKGATGTVTLLNPAGSMGLEGLVLQQCGTGVHYANTGAGSLEVVNTSFVACTTGIEADGSVAVSVTSTPKTAVLGNGGSRFISAIGSSTVSVSGGVLQNYMGAQVFDVHGDAVANVGDVQILDGSALAIGLRENGKLTLHDSTVSTKGVQLALLQGQSELTVTNADLSIQAGVATRYECIRLEMNGVGALTLTDVKLHHCSGGVNGSIPGELTLLRVEIYDHTYAALSLGNGFGGNGGKVRITDSKLHDNDLYGIVFGSSVNLNDFKMRGTSVAAGIGAVNPSDAIRIDGSLASTYDFGKVGDPGNNTILGAAADRTGLRLMQTGATVYAVGNTWTPSVEGADAAGHYTAPAGAGQKLDVPSPVAAGINYIEAYNGTTLRLAENP